MAIYEIFSKRMKRIAKQGQPEVYQYKELPEPFRVQVVHIWRDALPPDDYVVKDQRDWEAIHNTLARELGVFSLVTGDDRAATKCFNFLLRAQTENALDLIELSFKWIHRIVRDRYGFEIIATQAIEELNHRFREHNIGYQFAGGEIIRVDSQFIHAEVVKPALALLHENRFRGAEEEFLKAHEHYRHGRAKEAIADALKAFESTMKAICDARKWSYAPPATAKPLLQILFDRELIPPAMQSHFSALRTTLEAGLPTVRNKTGGSGHGQGAEPVVVPDFMAAYALHLAATNIHFLVQAHKAKS